MRTGRVSLLIALWVIILMTSSCGGSKTIIGPDISVRGVLAGVSAEEEPLTSPATITASMVVSTALKDNGRADYVAKAEVNFGDGSGWKIANRITASQYRLTHTYTEPGEYTVNARATYWDGEVVDATTWIVPVSAGTE